MTRSAARGPSSVVSSTPAETASGVRGTLLDPSLRVTAVLDGYRVTSPARQLFASSVGLHARGHASAVVVLNRTGGPTPLLIEAARLHVPTTVVTDAFGGDPRVLWRLRAAVRRNRPQVLETHGYKASVVAALLAPTLRIPWVAFLHGQTRENLKVRLYFALEQLAVRRADRVVVVSQEMARRIAASGIPGDRLRVIRTAHVPVEGSGELSARRDVSTPAPVVGVVARLSPEKGVDIALHVHRAVVDAHPDAQLLVLGEGPERKRLGALAARLGLSDHVTWAGFQDDPSRFYPGMAVVLIPSRSEGLPQTVLEAMSHGRPVVATMVGGLPEVVQNGSTGFLAPPGDVAALAARVAQLLDDPVLRSRLGQRARAIVEARFSLDAKVDALTRMYRELCQ